MAILETTYDIQRELNLFQLPPIEYAVACQIAMAKPKGKDNIRIRLDTIMEHMDISYPHLKRAVRSLIKKGVMSRQVTGRSSIYTFQRYHPRTHRGITGDPSTLPLSNPLANHSDVDKTKGLFSGDLTSPLSRSAIIAMDHLGRNTGDISGMY